MINFYKLLYYNEKVNDYRGARLVELIQKGVKRSANFGHSFYSNQYLRSDSFGVKPQLC